MVKIITVEKSISAEKDCGIVNITETIEEELNKTGLREGQVLIFTVGSTSGVSTIEYEPNLVKDFKEIIEDIIPKNRSYHHDYTWHDANGFSHLRSTFIKTSLVVPFKEGRLLLGTWQQIVIINFDNHRRQRRYILQFIGKD